MSNPMIKGFQIIGPTNNPYPGTICLTQIPLPVNASVKPGDLATIQVVEQAQHGAALYSVSYTIYKSNQTTIQKSGKQSKTQQKAPGQVKAKLTCTIVRRHHLC